jgi:hypothetical protein
MTRVVIIGEIYNAGLEIGGGPIYPGFAPGVPTHPIQPVPPGYWGGVAPPYPDQGLPGQPPRPTHPIAPGGQPPPGYWGGSSPHPDQGLPGQPPGYWGGVAPPYPDQGLPGQPPGYWGGSSPHPDQGLPGPQPPPGGTEVPEDVYTPAPIPEELASQYVVSVYDPKTTNTTTKSYPPR